MNQGIKYSQSQGRVWELVDNLSRNLKNNLRVYSDDQNNNNNNNNTLNIINAFHREISTYSLEELVNVLFFLHCETNLDTLIATHTLISRTLIELRKRVKNNDYDNNLNGRTR